MQITKENERKFGIVLTYVTLGLQAVISFVYVRLLLGLIGTNEYGLYQTMGAFIAYFSIMDFGLSSTIIRFYSRYAALEDKKSMENVLSISAMIYSIIAALIVVAGCIIYFQLDSIFVNFTAAEMISAKKIFIVLLINIATTIPSKIFDAIITSHEKFVFIKIMTLVQTLIQPIVIIAVLTATPTAFAIVIVQTVFNLILILIKVIYSFTGLKTRIRIHYFDKPLLFEMLRFSFFIFLQATMDQLFWQSNKVIIGIIYSTAAVAIYGIAHQVVMSYVTFSTAFGGVFLPRVTTLVANKEPPSVLSNLFIKIGRLQYLILLCVLTGFISFGKLFIAIISDFDAGNVQEAYIIALILMIPYTIDLIQNIGITIMQAYNKLVFRSISFLVISIVNVILSVILGLRFGIKGSAFSTGICCFIANVVLLNPYYQKRIKIDIPEFWKQILKISIPGLVCLAFGLGMDYFVHLGGGIQELLVKVAIYLVFYAIIIWFLALNKYEKGLLLNVVNKFKKKLTRQ